MYDAIIVGARCAGAPTGLLLARKGYRVLIVDRATFPSDTVSTHLLWPHGADMLARWGLLASLAATGAPPICQRMTFDVGPFALHGNVTGAHGGQSGFCPRRTVLDALLVQAAGSSGAEIREAFAVEALVYADDAVIGIRGRHHGGVIEERARMVIGADGVHSFVANAVGAPAYDTRPIAACAYYSYFADVRIDDVELYVRDGCAFGGGPTNDNLTLVMVNWPAVEFAAVRSDVEGHVWRALEHAPDFAARVRAGRRMEKWYGTAGVPNYFRTPYGPGWALVGDAGYNRDPMTAQGISDAFLDAAALSDAIDRGLSGGARLEETLAAYEAARNDRVRPMYEFTYQLAQLEPPPPPMRALFAALRDNPEDTDAFLSAITGGTPLTAFMARENLQRIVSTGGERAEASEPA